MIRCMKCGLTPADQDRASLLWATCNRCGASFHAHKHILSNAEKEAARKAEFRRKVQGMEQ